MAGPPGQEQLIPVPPDRETLAAIAEYTGAEAFDARERGRRREGLPRARLARRAAGPAARGDVGVRRARGAAPRRRGRRRDRRRAAAAVAGPAPGARPLGRTARRILRGAPLGPRRHAPLRGHRRPRRRLVRRRQGDRLRADRPERRRQDDRVQRHHAPLHARRGRGGARRRVASPDAAARHRRAAGSRARSRTSTSSGR